MYFDRTEKGAGRNGNRSANLFVGNGRSRGGREAPAVRNKSGKVGAGMESLSGACAAERLSSPNTAMKAAFSRTIGLFHESKT